MCCLSSSSPRKVLLLRESGQISHCRIPERRHGMKSGVKVDNDVRKKERECVCVKEKKIIGKTKRMLLIKELLGVKSDTDVQRE